MLLGYSTRPVTALGFIEVNRLGAFGEFGLPGFHVIEMRWISCHGDDAIVFLLYRVTPRGSTPELTRVCQVTQTLLSDHRLRTARDPAPRVGVPLFNTLLESLAALRS